MAVNDWMVVISEWEEMWQEIGAG